MKIEASAKSVRISPRKARLVVNEVRGLSVIQAESILQFMNKKGAEIVLKVVRSAAANAVHNSNLAKKDLIVSEISVNEGFTIKRFMPRAFGRATPIRKRTSHIRVVLAETAEAKQAREAGKKTVKKAAAEKNAEAPKAEIVAEEKTADAKAKAAGKETKNSSTAKAKETTKESK